MRDEERRVLIDHMLEARNESEVETAEKAADEWLKDNPGDIRVIAAHERLAERGSRVRDPERKANRAALAVVADTLTGNPYAALAAGLLVTLPVTELVWEMLYEHSGDGVAPRDGEG